jgi:HD domain
LRQSGFGTLLTESRLRMIPNPSFCDLSASTAQAVPASRDPLIAELIATKAFKRLQSIHFLGGIDYLLIPFPNGIKSNIRHTRYQHSLGVAQLALLYSDLRDLPFDDRRHVCAAALLHDIGHPPFSHSLEPVFEEAFGIEHHQATADILTGRVPLGRAVYETLRRYQTSVERIVAIIAGDDANYDSFFSGPINFDTIEGILRTISYAKLPLHVAEPQTVVKAALWRRHDGHLTTVDDFWQRKDFVYQHIINSTSGILADYACQTFMRQQLNLMTHDDYYSTEAQLFHKLSGLRQLLTSPTFAVDILKHQNEPIIYTARRFFIVPDGDFFGRDDKTRYQQTRNACTLSPQTVDLTDIREHSRKGLSDEPGNRPSKGLF